MASANISFYVSTGAEIHWRQAASFQLDPVALKIMSTGLAGMLIAEVLLIVGAYFATPYLYDAVGCVIDAISWFVGLIRARLRCWGKRKGRLQSRKSAEESAEDPILPESEEEDVSEEETEDDYDLLNTVPLLNDAEQYSRRPSSEGSVNKQATQGPSLLKRSLILSVALLVLILRCARPGATSYAFLSQTLVLTPFARPPQVREWSELFDLSWLPGNYDDWLGNRTALDITPRFGWAPPARLRGFRDWNGTAHHLHYNPAKDPLHISNLDLPVLDSLRDALSSGNVPIKHVMVIKLESTREDVFPLRNQSYIYDRIHDSYGKEGVPELVERNVANLTRTAERLTGMSSGFKPLADDDDGPQPYGGIHATNSYTSSTYTLKSLVGSLCGVSPLTVDFNREYNHHIYQPCLPHIFEAMNGQSSHEITDDFTTWPWHAAYMQAVTEGYDNQDALSPVMGYRHVVDAETIRRDHAVDDRPKHDKDLNFLGFSDTKLRPYFRRIFTRAAKNRERLFLTHLTGVSHFPWKMFRGEFDELIRGRGQLNRYLNTIGFADRWLRQILDLLEENGVANETLLVITGDQ